MAKWSKQAKQRVRSYQRYKARLKQYSRETESAFRPMSYKAFSLKYENRKEQVESGERKSIGNIASDIIRAENRPEVLYREYEKALDKRVDYMLKRGLTPDNALHLSYDEFRRTYNEYKNDLKLEVSKGERKSIGNIVKQIVSDQVYKISEKQFRETTRAIKEWNEAHPDKQINFGEGYNEKSVQWQMKIRSEGYEETQWYDLIRAKREELFKKGWSKKEVSKEIRRTFYGSP